MTFEIEIDSLNQNQIKATNICKEIGFWNLIGQDT